MNTELFEALFLPFKPKKPVETGIDTHQLSVKQSALEHALGFSKLDDTASVREKGDKKTEEMMEELILDNMQAIIDAYGGTVRVERKLDGNNCALKVRPDGEIEMLTSGGNPFFVGAYPELKEGLEILKSLGPGVYIGELHGIAPEGITEYNNLDAIAAVNRRRGMGSNVDADVLAELVTDMPLQLSLYDTYLMGDESYLGRPMEERREALEALVSDHEMAGITLAPSHRLSTPQEIYSLYLEEIESGEEGLVLKNPLAPIEWRIKKDMLDFKRNWDFIKFKKDLILDLIVLGYMNTESGEARGQMFTNVLLGVVNEESGMIETIVKSMGLSKGSAAYQQLVPEFERLTESGLLVPGYELDDSGKKIALPQESVLYSPKMKQDTMPKMAVVSPLENGLVAQVLAMQVTAANGEHSCGIAYGGKVNSLRHARLLALHPEKAYSPLDAESTQKIRRLA